MRRRRAVALTILGVPLALLLLVGGLAAWVIATPTGTRWAAEQARPYLPEGIDFETTAGRLAGPLQITGLRVERPQARVHIEHLLIDWSPAALWYSRIEITELAARELAVELRAGDAAADAAPADRGPLELPDRIGLPVPVAVQRLAIEDVSLQLPGGPVERLERLAARITAGPDAYAIEGLRLEGPRGTVAGDLRLGAADPFPVSADVDATVRAPPEALAPVTAALELEGSLRELAARLHVREPGRIDLALDARLLGDAPSWQGRLRVAETPLDAWWGTAPAYRVGADLALEGDLGRVAAEGSLAVGGLPTGRLEARLDAEADPERVRIAALEVSPAGRPATRVRASGSLALADPLRADLRLDWSELGWPLDEPARWTSPGGSLRVAGTLDDYRLSGEGRLRVPGDGEPARLSWQGNGSLAGLRVLEVDGAWREARAEVAGNVDWADAARAEAEVRLSGLDPQRLGADVSGSVGARARMRAGWGEALTADLELRALEGRLAGEPLSGDGVVRYRAGRIGIEDLRAEAGPAALRLSGTVADSLGLDWAVDLPDIATFVPQVEGAVEGSGRLAGTASAPRLTGEIVARELAGAEWRVARARLSGEGAADGRSELRLEVDGVEAAGEAIERLEARLRGAPDEHRLELSVAGERGDVEAALAGGLDDGAWAGRLLSARLVPAGRQAWTLASPAGLAWDDGGLDVGQACLVRGGARACAGASMEPGGQWRVAVDATTVPVAVVGTRWRDDLSFDGTFSLEARLRGGGGEPVTGRARLEPGAGRIVGALAQETTTLLDYDAGRATVELDADVVRAAVQLPLAEGGRIAADLALGRGPEPGLDGRVEARVEDLSLIAAVVSSISTIEGSLVADLELGGTLGAPSVAGGAAIADGRVGLGPLGIELYEVEAEVSTRDTAVELVARASSGEGRLVARTSLRRDPEAGWRGSGTITGDDFLAADLPDIRLALSPQLDWSVAGRDVSITGEVTVPSASIEPRDLSGTVRTSPDAVVVRQDEGGRGPAGADGEDDDQRWRVTADVAVTLGSDVSIDAFGLDGRLGGALRVQEVPGKLTTATGELRVEEGTYTIYRQTLEIERGRVLFSGGPIADPGLDVRAVRRPRNVLVGVRVRGTLREPRVELFSEPPMQESQVLSYLVVGLPLNETSSGEQSTVAAAATALARSQPGSRIAGELGIEEVSVEQGDPGEGASIVLGRYLSPRLYVGYGIGLMEKANSVRMRYELSRHWTVEARSGGDSSADLLYTIEVDESVEAIPTVPIPEAFTGTDAPHPGATRGDER